MSVHDTTITVHERFKIIRPEGLQGIFASTGPRYAGASFGRDSIEAGEDLIEFDDVIPRDVLLKTASLQGLGYNEDTEEEPGKIHHLHRYLADMVSEANIRLYHDDSLRWGSDGKEMIYYGSIDATPLFGRLAIKYILNYGDDILHEHIVGRDGQTRRFDEHLRMAVDWILHKLNASESGMVEFMHTNPRGEMIQVWKDSINGYVHIDGSQINYRSPIVPLEVQGYAYDALKGYDELVPGGVPKGLLGDLSQRVLDNFWLKDEQMFAQALDRDEDGALRPVRTPTSNSGLILDSNLLQDIPSPDNMVDKTVKMLLGPDFMTRAGIRCRSLAYAHLIDYPDYHGSYTVWYKETVDFIKGLKRFGRIDEAKKLAGVLISSLKELGEYFEYAFVDDEGQYVPINMDENRTVTLDIPPTSKFANPRCHIPEPGQAWTVSAFCYCLWLQQQN